MLLKSPSLYNPHSSIGREIDNAIEISLRGINRAIARERDCIFSLRAKENIPLQKVRRSKI